MWWKRKRSQPGPATQTFDPETLSLINNEIAGRLVRQTAAGSQVDTKATFVAGIVVIAAPFFASQGPFTPALAGTAFALYALTFVFAVAAIAPIAFKDVPEPKTLYERFGRKSTIDTLNALISARVNSYETNQTKHRRKVKWWRASVALLTASLAVSVGAVLHTKDCAPGEREPDAAGIFARACRSSR